MEDSPNKIRFISHSPDLLINALRTVQCAIFALRGVHDWAIVRNYLEQWVENARLAQISENK